MSNVSNTDVTEQIARLQARLADLEMAGAAKVKAARRRSMRHKVVVPAVLGTVSAAGVLVMAGFAGATPTTSTTDVAITPLTLGHKVLSNVTISANKTTSPVVAGGSTTVPTNATTVRIAVTAKGIKAGSLSFYPTGNVGGGSGQYLSYPGFNTVVNATIEENVGQANELTFHNAGAGSVVVNATVTGYSTQVTAGDIGGTGGSTGQVLTNNGSGGASWQNMGAGGPAGGVLTGSYPNPGLGVGVIGATNLQSGSVTAGAIANGAVQNNAIAGGAVGTSALADHAVDATKVSSSGGSNGQVLTNTGSGAAWQTLPAVTAAGISGGGGTTGQVLTNTGSGAAWQNSVVSGYQIVVAPGVSVPANSQLTTGVSCPAGKVVVGGGGLGFNFSEPGEYLMGSYPASSSLWRLLIVNATATPQDAQAYAVCVNG